MMAIMGASGAGKSTLLDAWSGLGWGEGFCLEWLKDRTVFNSSRWKWKRSWLLVLWPAAFSCQGEVACAFATFSVFVTGLLLPGTASYLDHLVSCLCQVVSPACNTFYRCKRL